MALTVLPQGRGLSSHSPRKAPCSTMRLPMLAILLKFCSPTCRITYIREVPILPFFHLSYFPCPSFPHLEHLPFPQGIDLHTKLFFCSGWHPEHLVQQWMLLDQHQWFLSGGCHKCALLCIYNIQRSEPLGFNLSPCHQMIPLFRFTSEWKSTRRGDFPCMQSSWWNNWMREFVWWRSSGHTKMVQNKLANWTFPGLMVANPRICHQESLSCGLKVILS